MALSEKYDQSRNVNEMEEKWHQLILTETHEAII